MTLCVSASEIFENYYTCWLKLKYEKFCSLFLSLPLFCAANVRNSVIVSSNKMKITHINNFIRKLYSLYVFTFINLNCVWKSERTGAKCQKSHKHAFCCCHSYRLRRYHSPSEAHTYIYTKIWIKFCCEKEFLAKNSFNAGHKHTHTKMLYRLYRESSSECTICLCLLSLALLFLFNDTQIHICKRTI